MTGRAMYPGAEPVSDTTEATALAHDRSCRECRRRQLHVSADIMRCTEKRSSAVDGVIWFNFKRTAHNEYELKAYEIHAQVVASRCKFYQGETA